MILIILAAGRGSRLKKKTDLLPKCLVKVDGKPIINHMQSFMKNFKKIIIVCGYKKQKLLKNFKDQKNITFVHNKKFKTTNMVYSLFLINKRNLGNSDVVISYSDIIFDYTIFEIFLKKKLSFITVYKNWYCLWKKRMPKNKIRNDAENLIVKKNKVTSIGEKITSNFPKYQFMGLTKLKNKDFFNLRNFFLKEKNFKIDFTNFLNSAIKSGKLKLNYFPTNKLWLEIDNANDAKVAERLLKK